MRIDGGHGAKCAFAAPTISARQLSPAALDAFMLVSTFSELDTMKYAYAHAIGEGYRFYSYGDACLLFRAGD
jgi:hypothetical protein